MKVRDLFLALALVAPPAAAQDVQVGSDLYTISDDGSSSVDMSMAPLPAGTFGPASLALTSVVPVRGVTIEGTGLVGASLVLERRATAALPACPSFTNVPVELRGFRARSIGTVAVPLSGGGTSKYTLEMTLSSVAPQTISTMSVSRFKQAGGSFGGLNLLQGTFRLKFTKVAGPGFPSVVVDPFGPHVFGATQPWGYTDGGLGVPTSPGGMLDHDGDGVADKAFPPSSNFFSGVDFVGGTCSGGGLPFQFPFVLTSSAVALSLGAPQAALAADATTASVSAGGTQNLTVDAGPPNAALAYFVLGSASGTSPGLVVDGTPIPLVLPDPYFNAMLFNPNTAGFTNTLGLLDGQGRAAASINAPPGLNPGFVGLSVSHAYVVLNIAGLGGVVFASNPVQLTFVP